MSIEEERFKKDFESWLLTDGGNKPVKQSTATDYVRAVTDKRFSEILSEVWHKNSIWEITNPNEIPDLRKALSNNETFQKYNRPVKEGSNPASGGGSCFAALAKYAYYLESRNHMSAAIVPSTEDIILTIKEYIAGRGFSYDGNLIENFYLSLKSKPFVILAGTSGTGKTRLVKLFADAIGAEYKLVSVRPDWSDSSDLFGHVDLNGNFVPGEIIDFIKQAAWDLEKPYFLCLDEMNLARVEYYLSDFLSVIETREKSDGKLKTVPLIPRSCLGNNPDAIDDYGSLTLPENLYVVGTVNMDETTFPFSKKVLDRANTIEFSYVDLNQINGIFDMEEGQSEPLDLPNSFLKSDYLLLKDCADDISAVETYCAGLEEINKILGTVQAHVGYRVRDEAVFYLLNNKKAGLLSENEAMDNVILQKILPRIQGSSSQVKDMLVELFKYCIGNANGIQKDSDSLPEDMEKALGTDSRYVKSANKIIFMVRRFEQDGFTSYWL